VSVLKLSREDNGKLIKLRQDDAIIVSLQETPTTGYRWAVDNTDETILELQSEGFRTVPEAGLGGSGTRTLSFRAIKAGSVNLKLKLWREWAGEASITERYSLTINVLQ
jgi:inhibitor of cysteine peptidase